MTNYFHFCIKNYLLLYYLLFIIMQVNGTNETHNRTSRAKNSNIVDRRMYFAIAVSPQAHDSETGGSVTSFTRAFNKTLANITQSFWSHKNYEDVTPDPNGGNVVTYNITLEPLVIELPENGAFSSNFLERLCVQLEGRHVAAMLIVGSSPAAFTVALVASSSSVPILWARGTHSNFMTTLTHRDMHPYEIYLEPSAYETLQALRALFLQTHWHSFTILADDSTTSTILLRRELSKILSTPPLNPTISYLPRNANTHAIFRRLADISRATRGVVILMSDLLQARRVLDEAKRLNMVDGHFVWLWLDTGGGSSSVNTATEYSTNPHMIPSSSSSSAAASSSIYNSDFSSISSSNTDTNSIEGSASLTINSNSEKNRIKRDLIKNVHKINKSKSNLTNFSDIINSLINDNNNNLQSDIGNVPQIQTNLNLKTETLFQSQITKNNRVPNKMYYHTEDMWPTIKTTKSRDKRQIITTSYDSMMNNDNNNYLLKNDKFLLFNNFNNLETNKKKNRVIFTSSKNSDKRFKHGGGGSTDDLFDDDDDFKNDLPVGLLAIKVQPLKLDRHLIKGAVRLLAITLRNVLAKCPPEWIVTRTVKVKEWYASCWHNFPFNDDFNKFNSDGNSAKSGGYSGGKYKDNNINNHNNNSTISSSSSASLYGAQGNFSLLFARELKLAVQNALAGHKFLQENGVEKVDKSLVSNFEITNLVPVEAFNSDNQPNLDINAQEKLTWRTVGRITGRSVHLDTIVWPGGDIVVSGLSTRPRSVFRVVTALAPPFVMESELDEDGQCLRGLPCHRVLTSDKDNLTLVFNEMETHERLEEEEDENSGSNNPFDFRHSSSSNEYVDKHEFLPFQRYKYRTNCCYGLAMDLLENIAQELEFDFRLYIVADGLFGTQIRTKKSKRDLSLLTKKSLRSRYYRDGVYKHFGNEFRHYNDDNIRNHEDDEDYDNTNVKWNGIVGDLVSGAAHMSFAALSVSSLRSEVIDFSAPFFFSGVSFLAAPQQKTEIPLFSFLLPFSTELWIAIFTSLNITAIAVAVYEWLSPFGLNPWGRQRSKNFSMSSALWVMWGLLCGHLVAFKAPKSWPNKFLINVWGGFSVIFVASYTANIAALIAGLFFHNAVSNYHDRSLLSQKVGAPMSSAAEYYVQRANRHLWDHMSKYRLENVEEGVRKLRNGSLDILIADTPILDYYRATDHGCKLQKIGDTINEDAYGVGMTKGFPLKDSISAVIAKYSSNGYMDILQEKWYGGLPCFKLATDMAQPRPLGVAAVAGVFISLGVGMLVGCVILIIEHLFYRYTLPILRHKPKGTIWRSRNIMFFSQKLYRFINCVELVSPHHAARELVHTIRQGQITSLFQKSVKRKEHEQRRRRKSKAQFFEMIQEIRRVQQEERDLSTLESVTEMEIEEEPDEEELASGDEKRSKLSPNILRRHFRRSNPKIDTSSPNIVKSPSKRLFVKQLFSPRAKIKQSKSSSTLNVRRFSTDSVLSNTFNTSTAVGRRLSRDPSFLQSSPPDINSRRSSYLDVIGGQKLSAVKSPVLSIENISDCSLSDNPMDMVRKLSDVESIGRKLATLPKYTNKSTLNVLDNDLIRRKSDIIISSNNKFGSTEIVPIETAKSVHNIPESSTSKQDHDEIQLSVAKTLSNEEIIRRNQMTIQQLQNKLKNPKPSTSSSQPQKNNQKNPHIRIEIEDTSKPPIRPPPLAPKPKKIKQRHRSLGDHHNTQNKHQKLEGHSQSLDSSHPPQSSPEEKKHSRLSNPSQNRRPSSSRSSSLEKSRPPVSSRTTSLDQSQPHHSIPTRTSSLDTSQAHRPVPSTRTSSLDKSPSRLPPSSRTSSIDKSQSRPPSSRTSSLDKSQNRRTTSLDKPDGRRSRKNSSRCEEHDLPPAPPPPNCSPRNSNGKSPLERLSKDELVLLWRSSESELRSHLLKALRDKDVDDPP